MNRFIAALALASILSSCGDGNPTSEGGTSTVSSCTSVLVSGTADCSTSSSGTSGGSTATPAPTTPEDPDVYATEMADNLTVDGMKYDKTTGKVVFDNVAFDGPDNTYILNAAKTAEFQKGGSTFGIYENEVGADPNTQFFAVFRRSPDEYSQVGALGTNRYATFGFGGAAAQRLNGDGSLPNAAEQFVFLGEYAAVRTILADDGSRPEIQYVSGTTKIQVDIEDFNTVGAVEGVIVDRKFFDANGVQIFQSRFTDGSGNTYDQDYIALKTAQINYDNWTITSSDATLTMYNALDSGADIVTDPVTGEKTTSDRISDSETASGTWEGLFTGPDGQEVTGIVFVEGTGPVGIDTINGTRTILTQGQIREVGVFQAQEDPTQRK
ncbi:hypothetical protein [Sagittula sp. S175]|uniref:hypothetical protein n=1 Tax=Sagittula sp. S175 TaxID=3415129 RepID=UPI003C7C674D